MAKPKLMFERLGFDHVKTFIASGNVVFCTDSDDVTALTIRIESAIEQDFGFPISVLLRGLPSIERLVKDLPAKWVNDQTMKCAVMFLWPAIDRPEILEQIPSNPDVEDVIYLPGAVVWRVDRDKIRRGQVLKIGGTNIHKQLTVRNPNTVRKLYELMLAVDK